MTPEEEAEAAFQALQQEWKKTDAETGGNCPVAKLWHHWSVLEIVDHPGTRTFHLRERCVDCGMKRTRERQWVND